MTVTPQAIEQVVVEVAGQDILLLVKTLRNRTNVSEFTLATQIKKEINVTRNMLYRLYDHNLVSFTRKKDKKKGWYIYYWTFNTKRIPTLLADLQKRKLERLQERLQREKNSTFFACPSGCIRLVFDQAADFNYKCPECGTLLNQEDNSAKVTEIEKEITQLHAAVEAAKPKITAKKKQVAKKPVKAKGKKK